MEFTDIVTIICYVVCGWYVGRTQEARIYLKKLEAESELMEEMLALTEVCTKEVTRLRTIVEEIMEEANGR